MKNVYYEISVLIVIIYRTVLDIWTLLLNYYSIIFSRYLYNKISSQTFHSNFIVIWKSEFHEIYMKCLNGEYQTEIDTQPLFIGLLTYFTKSELEGWILSYVLK